MKSNKVSHSKKEVSIASTLGRTICLLGITFTLMAIVRFCKPATHIMQHIAGTAMWQYVYKIFHIEDALGREQILLSAIIMSCFCVALVIQTIFLWALKFYILRYHRRG